MSTSNNNNSMINNNNQHNNQNQNNNQNNNKNLFNDLLLKIQNVSKDEYESICGQIFEILDEGKHKTSEKHVKEIYIEKLVDLYLQTFSDRVLKILIGISSPLDECFFNVLMKKINMQGPLEKRFTVFILMSNIVHRSPTWLKNIVNISLLNCFFNILKNEQEIVILAISALILVELIATLPCLMSQCLDDIFVCFSRLSTFLYKGMNLATADNKKNPGDKRNLSFLSLNSIVYRVFIRLYAMYPCNFLNYLKHTYGIRCNKENRAVFHHIIEPMLNKIRFHPLLITASKDDECDKSRWKYKEPHDILDECGQYSIDPIESSYFDDDVFHFYDLFPLDDDDDDHVNESQNENFYPNYVENSNSIFSILSKEFNEKDKTSSVNSLKSLLSVKEANFDVKVSDNNLESAQEAIMLSKDSITASNDENNLSKNLVKPVPISGNAKISLLPMQKKNMNKKQCFSPFKPIKEIGNNNNNGPFNQQEQENESNSKETSPIDNQLFQNRSNSSVDHFQINNVENEDVDMEIISYNLENKLNKNQSKEIDSKTNFTMINDGEILNDEEKHKTNGKESKVPEELIRNIKTSFKQINRRMRYQSNCLPETDRDEHDYPYSISLAGMQNFSKSCPMLYFKSDDEFEIVKDNENSNNNNSNINSSNNNNNNSGKKEDKTKDIAKNCSEKTSKVNLILNNPNAETLKQSSTTGNKACRSVDFTKESKARQLSNHIYDYSSKNPLFNKLFSSLMDSKRHLFQSSSSIDFQAQQKFEVSSPHELLDRTLSTLSDVYLKDCAIERQNHGITDGAEDSNQTSRRDSILNTNSSASSIEHIPSLNYLNSNPTEEDMKKILAIMYAQLVFERHQRDLHVIRNRRLYKKSKECIQLEEKYNTLKEQIKLQIKEKENLNCILKKKLLDFEMKKKMFCKEINGLHENLEKYKKNFEILKNEKIGLELHYKQEIEELNKNFRTKELELNKYLCNFNKNIDLMKLEKENLELKNQIFLFGEFCGKIRDAYCHNKTVPEFNDKLILESLRLENDELRRKNVDLRSQLKLYLDKSNDLENQLKQEELKHKNKVSSDEIEYYQESLKLKDNEIHVLKTLVVQYESHVEKLNGEIKAKLDLKKSNGN